MIEFLFSALLVPLFPDLESPATRHAQNLSELQRRLNEDRNRVVAQGLTPDEAAAEASLALGTDVADLPKITGRVFAWSAAQARLANESSEGGGGLSAESLRLTGVIESSGQRVAILNDGQVDHVVGLGSYVMDSHKVIALTQRQVVLSPIDSKARGKNLELNLTPGGV